MLRIKLAPTPPKSSFQRPLDICSEGCRNLVKAPVQGLRYMVVFCMDCHRIYLAVPLKEWGDYMRKPAPVEIPDPRVLPFRAG